jgi:dsDNA-specific endonuclease/ATPase MutS2
MVLIHGVGKGVLRSEVQRILKSNEFVHKLESGWQAGYGFGATIAYFKYS